MDLGTFKGLSVYDSAELSTLHILLFELNIPTEAGSRHLGGRKRTGLAELDVAFRGAWALDTIREGVELELCL